MSERFISPYQRAILSQLGCSADEAAMVEDIVRKHIFHSTLNWQTEAGFPPWCERGLALFESEREMFEEHYRHAREVAQKGIASAGND
jgi:hypothetical protein